MMTTEPIDLTEPMRVILAIIWNKGLDEILISQRPEIKEFGGLWEFPGGKVEHLERDAEALDRELNEELGIFINDFAHRMDFMHHYDDKTIEFVAYDVYSFEGTPEGREGQTIKWIPLSQLDPKEFPPADVKFIQHILLDYEHA